MKERPRDAKEKSERGRSPAPPSPPPPRAPPARHLPHYNLHFTARCPLCAACLFVRAGSGNSRTESGGPQEAFLSGGAAAKRQTAIPAKKNRRPR